MSFSKMDQVFPLKPRAISDAELARIVGHALRHDFGETSSSIKHIGRLTGANPRTVKNWYIGVNVPSSGHLLLLARSSETLLQFILGQIGGEDLQDAFSLLGGRKRTEAADTKQAEKSVDMRIYGAKSCTINVALALEVAGNLNQRQLWFLGVLQQGKKPKADDIVTTWKVSTRTAKYDIGALLKADLIRFTGPKKTGRYEIADMRLDISPKIRTNGEHR